MSGIEDRLKEFLTDGSERVGFVLDDGTIVEVENESPSPEDSFLVPPESLVEYEDRVIATWHTHPTGSSNLSVDDLEGFKSWPDWVHYVVGVDGVRSFRVDQGRVLQNA